MLDKCSKFFLEHEQYEKAVELLVVAKQVNVCVLYGDVYLKRIRYWARHAFQGVCVTPSYNLTIGGHFFMRLPCFLIMNVVITLSK